MGRSVKILKLCIYVGLTNRMEYWGGVNEELFFWAPDRQPHGIMLCLLSYNGNARLTLAVDQVLMTKEEVSQ